jgi:hypothetical protein
MKFKANPVIVDAYPITSVRALAECFVLELGETHTIHTTPDLTARMVPVVGDYWVLQSDGYSYLNPKAVFERKYSPLESYDPLRILDEQALALQASGRASRIVRLDPEFHSEAD